MFNFVTSEVFGMIRHTYMCICIDMTYILHLSEHIGIWNRISLLSMAFSFKRNYFLYYKQHLIVYRNDTQIRKAVVVILK